jgi:hypothetical protein
MERVHSTSDGARQDSDLVFGKPRSFWTARSTFVVIGATAGTLAGVLSAALLIWAAPASHWIRDSWLLVCAGYAAVMAFMSILIFLFLWWIAFGIPRRF